MENNIITINEKKFLEELTVEQLLEKLHPDLMVGNTHWSEPQKKYMVCMYDTPLHEAFENGEMITDNILDISNNVANYYIYGHTAKEVLIKAILEYSK